MPDPPSEARVTEMAWRNLLTECRRAIGDRLVENLEELDRLERIWERRRDLDKRYVQPLQAEDFHLPGAGCSGATTKARVVAVRKEIDEEISEEMSDASRVRETRIST